MKININIETGNSAFWNENEDSENQTFNMQEVERILKEIISEFGWYRDSGKCIDINGNTVGSYSIEWGGIDSE
tara:strand:+ start:343 stop:561 length:219 start_codon:yes stop_codon:yes gene_type:complete